MDSSSFRWGLTFLYDVLRGFADYGVSPLQPYCYIAGLEIVTAARLAEVLGVEGATELHESAFSSDGLSFTLQRTGDGKIMATVTPVGSPPAFFLRVKVK